MNYQVQMTFSICPAGPLLISDGSGNKMHPELPDSTFLMSWDGAQEAFVIPGSSLKGVMRCYLEQMKYNPHTITCLFGNADKQNAKKSKISVSDAFADMETVETTLRHSTALGSVSQSAKQGSLRSMQTVTSGSFAGNIRLAKVNKEELQLTLRALQAIENGEICLGGKNSMGFGRVKINQFCMTVSSGYDENLRPVIQGTYDGLEAAAKAAEQMK
jgi:CRISPR/Cas system CSM-associated protein Csm3 (group 7 of RAMP superfamily)